MKKLEITLAPHSLTIRREAEEHMTGEQRYNLLMALIGLTAGCTFFLGLFGLFR